MKVALIGGGAMGGALLTGWRAAGHTDLCVVEPNADRAAELCGQGFPVVSAADAATADVVVLSVKPHIIASALAEIAPDLRPGALVVSIAAGVPLRALEEVLPDHAVAFRVMPNTPALVGKGMAGLVPGAGATDEQTATVRGLLDTVGKTTVVPEKHLDALTALSGSGPAYLFYVAEAMIEAGVHQGLTRQEATQLVNQTFVGASAMLAESGRSATELREMVTSPAGTTAAALRSLDDDGVRAAFLGAVEACVRRAQEMAD